MASQDALEERLGVKFKNPGLLHQALVHSSYVNENPDLAPESNERLEFLGDAVLGMVVAEDLYQAYPGQDEGTLTELRAHLVRRDTLADAGRALRLGEELRLGRGEAAGGGHDRPTNLAHVYEAVVGAIYLDLGLASARDFIRRSLEEQYQVAAERAVPLDPKSRLQELSQALYQRTPRYSVMEAEGPDHEREFTVEVIIDDRSLGVGKGRSKQLAEKAAAGQALKRLEEPPGDQASGTSSACT